LFYLVATIIVQFHLHAYLLFTWTVTKLTQARTAFQTVRRIIL